MKPLVAAVAVLVALVVGVQAQTPDIDALRARAEQGDAEAARWYRLAADQGNTEEQCSLGE
jgi:TPR repeat protein